MAIRPIYLDFQATTPMDERAFAAMAPFFTSTFGNPHAQENLYGQAAADAVSSARSQVANLIRADDREIVFTSGATEANNLLIRGVARALAAQGRPGIVTSAIEHKAVLDVVRSLEGEGHPIRILDVDEDGRLDPDRLLHALDERTGLVTVMAANNEVGVLQPLDALAAVCRASGVIFHSDAAQAIGKVPLSFRDLSLDLLSMSGHKLYGPPGIGVAVVSKRVRRLVRPLFAGGGQEAGLRPGTVPAALCVGLGVACAIAEQEAETEAVRLRSLSAQFLDALDRSGTDYKVNGSRTFRLPGNLNLSFSGVDAEALLMATRSDLAISTGSACTSSSLEPSHVLKALGLSEERAESAVRIGLGRTTTEEEVLKAAQILSDAVTRLRSLSYSPRIPVGLAGS